MLNRLKSSGLNKGCFNMNKIVKIMLCAVALQTTVIFSAANAGKPIAVWLLNNSAWHSGDVWIQDEAGNKRGDTVHIKQADGHQQVELLGEILPGWTVHYNVGGTFFGYQKTYAYDDIVGFASPNVLITFEQKTNRALDAALSRYHKADDDWTHIDDVQPDVSGVSEKYLLDGKVNMRKIRAAVNNWADPRRANSVKSDEIDEVIRALKVGDPSWDTIADSLERYKAAKERGEKYVVTLEPDAVLTENLSAFLLRVVRAIDRLN
jgi:hypothetical protein